MAHAFWRAADRFFRKFIRKKGYKDGFYGFIAAFSDSVYQIQSYAKYWEMNKQSKQFITELGKSQTKTVVSEVESTLVNVIKDTPVRGYEVFAQDVTLTKNNYYRAWIGLRLPMGEFNKMYNYTIEEAVDAYNIKSKAQIAYDKVLGNTDEKDSNLQ